MLTVLFAFFILSFLLFFHLKSICNAYVKRITNKKYGEKKKTERKFGMSIRDIQWIYVCQIRFIVLSFFCSCDAFVICCGKGSEHEKKECQSEVGAYVIFVLLIYSILKYVSRDVPTNACFFLLITALQHFFYRENVWLWILWNKRLFC